MNRYQTKSATNIELKLPSQLQLMISDNQRRNDELFKINHEDGRSFRIEHKQFRFIKRRIKREDAKALRTSQEYLKSETKDPTKMQANSFGFHKRVRNKRAKLSKLQNEYRRCKKQSVNNRDCMVAFVRMYNLAHEINERMEKMKAILRDSELVLQNNSTSTSSESIEEDTIKKTFDETTTKIDTTTLTPSIAAENSTSKVSKAEKIKPSKISWILDGNDGNSSEKGFAVLPELTQDLTTASTAITDDNTSESTQAKTVTGSLTTELIESIESSMIEEDDDVDDDANWTDEMKSSTDSSLTTVSTDMTNSTALGGDNEGGITSTANSFAKVTSETTTTEAPPGSSTEAADNELKKISWIIDGAASKESFIDNFQNTTASLDTTTDQGATSSMSADYVSTERATFDETTEQLFNLTVTTESGKDHKLQFDWILDGDDFTEDFNSTAITTETSLRSTTTEPIQREANFAPEKPLNAEAMNRSLDVAARLGNEDEHPLDNPTSLENMLESLERIAPIAAENNKTIDPLFHNELKEAADARIQQEDIIDSFDDIDKNYMANFGPKLNPVNPNNFRG